MGMSKKQQAEIDDLTQRFNAILEQRVNDAVQFLLCRVLITRKKTPDDEYYYVQE